LGAASTADIHFTRDYSFEKNEDAGIVNPKEGGKDSSSAPRMVVTASCPIH